MSAAIDTTPADRASRSAFYTAGEVAELLRLARPTVYEIAREDPERLGTETFGRRCVRFRRRVIDELVNGAR